MKTAIQQHDISDCAAACIASVARHYGQDVPISLIRERSGTSQAGTSIKGILDACRAIGFQATGYKSDDKSFAALAGLQEPVILHIINEREDLHFVVLYGLRGAKARVMDPSRGKMLNIPVARLREQWTGYLVTLRPDPARPASETPTRSESLGECLRHVSRKDFLLMLGGSLVYIIAGVCTALFLQHIIDKVLPSADRGALAKLALLMLGVMGCTVMVGYGRILYSLRLSYIVEAFLGIGYESMYYAPCNIFNKNSCIIQNNL